jgi:transposase
MRNGKTYEYHQLVESFRRESDGMPATRVLANLGHLDAVALDNLKLAIGASREGKSLVLPDARPRRSKSAEQFIVKPTSSLRYLDVAVLLEHWRSWQLGELLAGLIGSSKAEASAADVIAALTIQRCVAPRSKLHAQRWFPRTALPELTGIGPGQFNNTRLHRVLEQLDQVTDELMRRLPRMYVSRTGAFASLFMDVTDTWFVGNGSELAEPGKTKEGMYAHKIGIVLLCNEHGYPIRWQVLPGRQHDSLAMSNMLRDVDGLSWVGEAPVVMDRAMGKTANIQMMLQTGLRFLTALTRCEFASYTDAIPHQSFAQYEVGLQDDQADTQRRAELGRSAVEAGMKRFDNDLYVLDLGEVEMPKEQGATHQALDQEDKTIQALHLGKQIDVLMREDKASSYQSAGRRFDLSKKQAHRCRQLAQLTDDIQQRIMQGEARSLSIGELLRLAVLDPSQQSQGFASLLKQAQSRPDRRRVRQASRPASTDCVQVDQEPKKVRLICYFNPDMFLEQRRAARDALRSIEALVAELNAKASQGRSRRDAHGLAGVITDKLRKHEMLDVFEIEIRDVQSEGSKHLQIELKRKEEPWLRRRRYDGLSVLVAHTSLQQEPSQLCRLYRGKDAIEKDFQSIKSLIKLRPIWHHTDPKVRAHVTLCMLALLLERTLKTKLEQSKHRDLGSRELLELLEDCRLNRYAPHNGGPAAYLCTEPTDDQLAILRALKLTHLAEDAEIADRITAR